MIDSQDFPSHLFNLDNQSFENAALEEFLLQYRQNPVYREYCDRLGRTSPQRLNEIPFMPVEFYKSHQVACGKWKPESIFRSSGTSNVARSEVLVHSLQEYQVVATHIFRNFYGDPSQYVILALLPGYLEKGDSSLVTMVDGLIRETGDELSGFFLDQYSEIPRRYRDAIDKGKKVILWGVTFALLELISYLDQELGDIIVIETGGMKGRGREIVRAELHELLFRGLGTRNLHSEYGMSELMSQAYSRAGGIFETPPWMKILIREVNDPLTCTDTPASGGINIADLANRYTCPFLATQDMGILHENGNFEVIGRLDNSDIRGCNLMII